MAQVPVAQVAVAFASTQATPHAPQFVSVVSEASQPLASIPSQLPYSGLHEAIWQVSVAHVAVAFARVQVVPHVPQLVSVFKGVSQPFEAMPSQLPQPGAHDATLHVPVAHVAVALGSEQVTPHEPQLVSVVSEVLQPAAGLPLQSPHPDAHVGEQRPLTQLVVPLGLLQTKPQEPQFDVVPREIVHPVLATPLQSPQPAAHVGVHAEFTQAVAPCGLVHWTKQPPHWLTLFDVPGTSSMIPSQSLSSPSHRVSGCTCQFGP
jgi:hypothetical protein